MNILKPREGVAVSKLPEKQRFDYIDQFRGLIVILMLVDHCSYYLNSINKYFDPFDPLFPSWGQFALRYAAYLCAPGFLVMSGAMVWWSYHKGISKGTRDWSLRWQLIQRGLFLILVQLTWVNSSWGGFAAFQPDHFGIIACIGVSIILLTLFISTDWYVRLLVAIAILVVHPFLLQIPYNIDIAWQKVLMQTFIDAGEFNKYPVLPWFAHMTLGSVMATGWLQVWNTDKKRIYMGLGTGAAAIMLSLLIRMGRGYGNIFPFSGFGSYSFFFDQKYPPSLYHSLWFFGFVVLGVTLFLAIGKLSPKFLMVFSIPGRVPLFFYAMHIAILGVFVNRLDIFYRENGVLASLLGTAVMLAIMIPLCKWFYGVKLRSRNYFIRMI